MEEVPCAPAGGASGLYSPNLTLKSSSSGLMQLLHASSDQQVAKPVPAV